MTCATLHCPASPSTALHNSAPLCTTLHCSAPPTRLGDPEQKSTLKACDRGDNPCRGDTAEVNVGSVDPGPNKSIILKGMIFTKLQSIITLLILTSAGCSATKSCESHADLLHEANDLIISLVCGRLVAHLIERRASSFGANGFVVASTALKASLADVVGSGSLLRSGLLQTKQAAKVSERLECFGGEQP